MKVNSKVKSRGWMLLQLTGLPFLLIWLLLGPALANTTAQEMLDRRISISFENTDLITVLDRLSEAARVDITYNSRIIPRSHTVTRDFNNVRVADILTQLLTPLDVTFLVMDKQVILRKRAATPLPSTPSIKVGAEASVLDKRVQGKVMDEKGEGLPGVSIILKGSQQGTTTDVEGNFSISVPNDESVLIFSFVGYTNQEVVVGNRTQLEINLVADVKSLQEVVVVGYGTQKKANLTGAVATVDIAQQAETRPITSLSSGLSGLASGLSVNQGSGRPGGDGATLRIRGQGTLNNSDPLVIIDGAVGNMNHLNPQDVESISVLKDAASAAIYGSRAANGVILITTKKGKSGEFRVNYNSFFSTAKPSHVVKTVSNYANYMELINEGFRNSDPNATPIFSQEKIDLWRANEGKDPLKYPNTEWTEQVFRPNLQQNHNLSFSGGTATSRYFGSFGYLDNPGIIEKAGYQRYSMRLNMEANVKPWLTLGTMLNGLVAKTDIGTNILEDVFTYAGASTPGMVLRAPDGRFGSPNNPEDDPQSNNVLHRLYGRKGDIRQNKLTSRFFGKLQPLEGLSIEGSFNYIFDDQLQYHQPVFNDRWDFINNTVATAGTGRSSVFNQNNKNYQYFMDGIVRYDRTFFSRLTMNLMVGASQEYYKNDWFNASKLDLVDPLLSVIDAATMDAAANGNASDWVMRSYFGRINLNLDDKYLFEANLRRDGTSRFAAGASRWGMFPSFSAGWRISEESFYDISWMPSLKVRASYGSLGNNAVGNYEYQAVYNAANYILNNNLYVGFAQTALSNAALTWESTYITNLGLDFGLFNNRLDGSLEVFDKRTKNILIDLPAPLVVGNASIPKQNAAEVQNKGIELNLNYRNNVGAFNYRVGGNFSFVDNKVTKFKGKDRTISGSNLIQEGYAINTQYVLAVDRIIQTDEDLALVQSLIDNAPLDPATGQKRNPFAAYGTPRIGDLLYKDMNGDGIINDEDRYTVGHGTAPRIFYGMNMGFDWKNFDFSVLLQGAAGLRTIWTDIYHTTGVRWGYQINEEVAEGRWYPGRTDATYPRLLNYTDVRNTRNSDFWLQNRSYMRLKNIQLGYTLPKAITEKVKISTLRVYGSLENYLTFTRYKGFDPEVSGVQYPTLKQALLGLNLTF
ncbi:TonB-dependent receptor [Telluribacter sp. SYSU D00476]|uniref:SusC/RagA family TonB-linked outer membrane protein n=1 Tax=Telluribacter sp. SYSU D00476 TaxID=2811430 RepID=UPI001FF38264|nr:TonB-dependent receptor [Telluribacter sp. SYSU D00476]